MRLNKLQSQRAVSLLWRGRHSDWLILCLKPGLFPQLECYNAALGGEERRPGKPGQPRGRVRSTPGAACCFCSAVSGVDVVPRLHQPSFSTCNILWVCFNLFIFWTAFHSQDSYTIMGMRLARLVAWRGGRRASADPVGAFA